MRARREGVIGRSKQLGCTRTSYASGLTVLTTDTADAGAFASSIAAEAEAIEAGFALLFFSQALFDAHDLAAAWAKHAAGLPYAGCSTAGEITPGGLEEGQAVAILFPSPAFSAVSTMVRGISSPGMEAIAAEVEQLKLRLYSQTGRSTGSEVHRRAFLLGGIRHLGHPLEPRRHSADRRLGRR